MYRALIPHPDSRPNGVRKVAVEIAYSAGDDLLLTFRVDGAEHLLSPDRVSPRRTDELWRTTCFELFVKPVAAESYFEFNFSPSTAWAAYQFDGYREGMRDLAMSVAPYIERGDGDEDDVIEVDFDLSDIPNVPLRAGLSAVIEELDGTKSYWALAHPPGPPDFHADACFALELPAASGA